MSNCTVTLKQGTIIGTEGILPNGEKYFSFKGVPYAKPAQRFRAPLPLETFAEKPLHCTNERALSCQRDMFSSEYIGSEDCLFLNVICFIIELHRNMLTYYTIVDLYPTFGT